MNEPKNRLSPNRIPHKIFSAIDCFCKHITVALDSTAQTPASPSVSKPAASAPAAEKSGPPEKPTPSVKKASPATPVVAAAPGGGEGKVWVNPASKTYHCPNTKYYGKTKKGEYMSEADAKAKGNHADHKKACS